MILWSAWAIPLREQLCKGLEKRNDLGVKYKFCMLFKGKRKTLPKTFLEACMSKHVRKGWGNIMPFHKGHIVLSSFVVTKLSRGTLLFLGLTRANRVLSSYLGKP